MLTVQSQNSAIAFGARACCSPLVLLSPVARTAFALPILYCASMLRAAGFPRERRRAATTQGFMQRGAEASARAKAEAPQFPAVCTTSCKYCKEKGSGIVSNSTSPGKNSCVQSSTKRFCTKREGCQKRTAEHQRERNSAVYLQDSGWKLPFLFCAAFHLVEHFKRNVVLVLDIQDARRSLVHNKR